MPVTIGSGDVGGPAHANIKEKNHLEEEEPIQEGFGFNIERKTEWPD